MHVEWTLSTDSICEDRGCSCMVGTVAGRPEVRLEANESDTDWPWWVMIDGTVVASGRTGSLREARTLAEAALAGA